jgi:hypothetical protein
MNSAVQLTNFSTLVVVTHTFANREANGLAESKYNMITEFDSGSSGVSILVETFGGERNYYFYIKPNAVPKPYYNPISNRVAVEQFIAPIPPSHR